MEKFVIDGGRPLNGEITPSGNKNEALPALMACLLTDKPVTLKRLPRINDVQTVREILDSLGVTSEWTNDDTLVLDASKARAVRPDSDKCSKVRASIMLLGPMLARFGKVELPLPGGDVIGARRIDSHWEGIEALGGKLEMQKDSIVGSLPKGIGTNIYMDEPSVTATENLLLLSVLCEGTTILHNAACEPHVKGLCNLLNSMGAKITGISSNRLTIEGVASLGGAEHRIGADFMEVGSFLCLGAIGSGVVKVNDVDPEDMRFTLKMFERIGIYPTIDGNSITIDGTKPLVMKNELSGRVSTIYSGPWPAFASDLMSVAIVAATQATGTIIFFEKMYESRMFFTDKLLSMGANIVLCDPHRVVITGPQKLIATNMSSPDVRAGMALLMAACVANGTSEIGNIYQIERGYQNIDKKLESLGASIKRVNV
jgi:UDP-N-acetylglucosamine 1-carboxyvinyltransferase